SACGRPDRRPGYDGGDDRLRIFPDAILPSACLADGPVVGSAPSSQAELAPQAGNRRSCYRAIPPSPGRREDSAPLFRIWNVYRLLVPGIRGPIGRCVGEALGAIRDRNEQHLCVPRIPGGAVAADFTLPGGPSRSQIRRDIRAAAVGRASI